MSFVAFLLLLPMFGCAPWHVPCISITKKLSFPATVPRIFERFFTVWSIFWSSEWPILQQFGAISPRPGSQFSPVYKQFCLIQALSPL